MPQVIDPDALIDWATAVLVAERVTDQHARVVSQSLVDADLRGLGSHGIARLPIYVSRIRQNLTNPAARPTVAHQLSGVASVDGHQGLGAIVADFAANLAVELSVTHGVSTVTAHHSTHCGAAGYYARRMAQAGVIALVTTNSEPDVIAFGGKGPSIGTNPLAFAAQSDRGTIVLDMATSQAAMGKIFQARREGTPVPAGWAVDAEGRPTTDPYQAECAVPLGGPKGFGLALLVEILSGVLSGSGTTTSIGRMYHEFDKPQNVGHCFIAIDPTGILGTKAAFRSRMNDLWDYMKAQRPADGVAEILLPGELEEAAWQRNQRAGLTLTDEVVRQLNALPRDPARSLPTRDGGHSG